MRLTALKRNNINLRAKLLHASLPSSNWTTTKQQNGLLCQIFGVELLDVIAEEIDGLAICFTSDYIIQTWFCLMEIVEEIFVAKEGRSRGCWQVFVDKLYQLIKRSFVFEG